MMFNFRKFADKNPFFAIILSLMGFFGIPFTFAHLAQEFGSIKDELMYVGISIFLFWMCWTTLPIFDYIVEKIRGKK